MKNTYKNHVYVMLDRSSSMESIIKTAKDPEDFGEWIVFVQSTSVNRKVIPKQRVLVFK